MCTQRNVSSYVLTQQDICQTPSIKVIIPICKILQQVFLQSGAQHQMYNIKCRSWESATLFTLVAGRIQEVDETRMPMHTIKCATAHGGTSMTTCFGHNPPRLKAMSATSSSRLTSKRFPSSSLDTPREGASAMLA